jgi:hypothetical protein
MKESFSSFMLIFSVCGTENGNNTAYKTERNDDDVEREREGEKLSVVVVVVVACS